MWNKERESFRRELQRFCSSRRHHFVVGEKSERHQRNVAQSCFSLWLGVLVSLNRTNLHQNWDVKQWIDAQLLRFTVDLIRVVESMILTDRNIGF